MFYCMICINFSLTKSYLMPWPSSWIIEILLEARKSLWKIMNGWENLNENTSSNLHQKCVAQLILHPKPDHDMMAALSRYLNDNSCISKIMSHNEDIWFWNTLIMVICSYAASYIEALRVSWLTNWHNIFLN